MSLRSRRATQHSQIPEVNLVPMMDVIMTILTFFIIVSMTLTNQKALNIPLPRADQGGSEMKLPDPMVVGLNLQGQVLLEGKAASDTDLAQRMQAYLTKNPQGGIILKADQKVTYEQVAKLLGKMQEIGGERVSLAIAGS
jgi:biopolymer transport protein ExbD